MKQSIVVLLSFMSFSGMSPNTTSDKQKELYSNISILEERVANQQQLLDSILLDLSTVELEITPELLKEINMGILDK